jgi:AraC-like DNA-binding protein
MRLLQKLKKEVDDNLTNDQFSVEELARNIGMSRSQLHRKLVTATGQSVSQFIREYRLQLGMDLLKGGDLTAAEVSERIGFGSATYFNKCFNEFYGFPPGEVKNRMGENLSELKVFTPVRNVTEESGSSTGSYLKWIVVVSVLIIIGIVYVAFQGGGETTRDVKDKSIAILPFKNLSQDQQNEYFGEGVIEAIRTGLSQIDEFRVISRHICRAIPRKFETCE